MQSGRQWEISITAGLNNAGATYSEILKNLPPHTSFLAPVLGFFLFFLFFLEALFSITCYLFGVIDLSAAHRPWAVLPLKLTKCEFSRIEPEGPKVSTQVPGPESVNLLRQLDEIQVHSHITFRLKTSRRFCDACLHYFHLDIASKV